MKTATVTLTSAPDIARRVELFPQVDETLLDDEERARFQMRKALIEAYIRGERMGPLLKTAGVAHSQMLRDFNRCLRLAEDGRIFGFRALVKYMHVKPYTQRARLEPRAKKRLGHAGEFSALLERMPDLATFLVDKLKGVRKAEGIKRITVRTLQTEMLGWLQAAGVTRDQYPFNTRFGGYRSLANFVKQQLDADINSIVAERTGDTAKVRREVGTGRDQNIVATAPYQVVQVDAHRCDFFGNVRIPTPKGGRYQAIRRIWIIVVLERFTKAILGYSISFGLQVNADDVLEALENAMNEHPLRELTTPGMAYEKDAGFPTTFFPELVGAGYTLLQLDNALAHLANAVVERARARLGCAINFGRIGGWHRRSDVERCFGALESAGFARVPSACGNNPNDPRFKGAVKRGAAAKIDYEKILDIVETILAAYNGTPSKGNDWVSPLEALRYALREGSPPFFPMPVAISTTTMPLSVVREVRPVRGNREEGRRPHVNLDSETYTSVLLSTSWHLLNQDIVLMIDERNIQTVRAFMTDGRELGVLTVQGRWRHSPHSRRIRHQVNSMCNAGLLKLGVSDDPVEILMRHYAEQALLDNEARPDRLSAAGAELARVQHATKKPIPEVGTTPPPTVPSAPALPPATRRPGPDVSVQANY